MGFPGVTKNWLNRRLLATSRFLPHKQPKWEEFIMIKACSCTQTNGRWLGLKQVSSKCWSPGVIPWDLVLPNPGITEASLMRSWIFMKQISWGSIRGRAQPDNLRRHSSPWRTHVPLDISRNKERPNSNKNQVCGHAELRTFAHFGQL